MDSLPGGSHKESLGVSFGVLGVRVPLAHRVSLKVPCGVCTGQGSQIQDRAVAQGVVRGVIFSLLF